MSGELHALIHAAGNDLHDNAVKLYTEVLRGQEPVLNASVKAEIENEDGDQWTVDLTDNGVGELQSLGVKHCHQK